MRQEHIAWYRQQVFLQGIAYVFLSFVFLTILVSFNNILPHLLVFSLGLAFGVLALLCTSQSILVNQVNRRS
jgi:hypothetical protein